jgi:hypothetical protein
VTRCLVALAAALALAGCGVVNQGPTLNDAQNAVTLLKFTNNSLPSDLSVTG